MIFRIVLALIAITLAMAAWELWSRRRSDQRRSRQRERHLEEQSEWKKARAEARDDQPTVSDAK